MRHPVLRRAYRTGARFHLRPQLFNHGLDVFRLQVFGPQLMEAGGLQAAVEVPLELVECRLRALRNRASVGPCPAPVADRHDGRISKPASHPELLPNRLPITSLLSCRTGLFSVQDTPLIP